LFAATRNVCFWHKADILLSPTNVRFSNQPVRVKRLQAIHYFGVGTTRGLALLFGIGTEALPAWDSRMRWNDLSGGLAVVVGRSKQTYELTSSAASANALNSHCDLTFESN
jgi:hypothetical protein